MENLHPLKIDESKDYGAQKYTALLEKYGGEFDIVLVSSGEDGHIAALYPDHKAMSVSGKRYIFLSDSPKPPANRITSSVELIHKAKLLIVLFIGESKREAYEKFNNARIPILDCPAKLALKVKNVIVYTDLK
jgi:6-phosphogluconolactonase